MLRLLDLRSGERVLDLACGQGVVSRSLHQAARIHVTGVDVSPRLIEMARQRSPKEITYLVADARKMNTLRPGSFDAITWVLAAQNMEPLEPVYTECARLLRAGGRLVMVINPPAFRIPRQSNWRLDEDRKLLVRTIDLYLGPLKIPISLHPFKKSEPQASTWTYHRPLQTYVNGLAAHGLWTNALEEWPSHKESQPGPMAKAEDRARREFPLFLALRAVRVEGEDGDRWQTPRATQEATGTDPEPPAPAPEAGVGQRRPPQKRPVARGRRPTPQAWG